MAHGLHGSDGSARIFLFAFFFLIFVILTSHFSPVLHKAFSSLLIVIVSLLLSAPLFAQESDSVAAKSDFQDTKFYHVLFDEPEKDTIAVQENDSLNSERHMFFYYPDLAVTSDWGLFIGVGASYVDYDSLGKPEHILSLDGGFATVPSKYKIQYSEKFHDILHGTLEVAARASSLDVLNFFSYGNETLFDKSRYQLKGYRVNQQQFSIIPKYIYEVIENTSIWGSAALRYIVTDNDPITDTTVFRKRYTYGIGKMTTARFAAGVAFDSRDNIRAASKGIYAAFGSYWTPEIINNKYAYTKLQADIRGYISGDLPTPFTFAARMRIEKIFGEHPFYEASLLGGANDLRGYYQDRFAGEESLLGTAELWIQLGRMDVLVPETFGLLLFADAGRVYIDNDFSNTWHSSFGGGLWIAPVSKDHTISFTVAHSPESTLFYLASGFTF